MDTKIDIPGSSAELTETGSEAEYLREELRVAGEKYSEIYELSPSGYLTLNSDHIITELNQSGCQILGNERSSLVGCVLDDFVSSETLNALQAFYKNMTASRSKEFCEVTIACGENKPRSVFIEGKVLGRYGELLLNIVDITAIERSALLLQQTRQNYETFYNTIDELLIVTDTTGRIISTNQAVRNRTGYTEQELEGMQIAALHVRERRLEAAGFFRSAVTGSSISYSVPMLTRAGGEIPVETVAVRGEWNGNTAIFVVSKDMSRIRNSEARVTLATDLAGEIYQPLNIISMILDKIQLDNDGRREISLDSLSEKTHRIMENIDRIRTYIDDIRSFSGHKVG